MCKPANLKEIYTDPGSTNIAGWKMAGPGIESIMYFPMKKMGDVIPAIAM